MVAGDRKKLLHAALALAARDIPVFPTNDKMPCWSNDELGLKKGEGGYKVATTDGDRIRFLFNNPRAVEIAVPMGEMSGLMCVDVDLYKDPTLALWIEGNASWLGSTLCHTTRSGGRHYFFRHVPDVHWPSTLQPGIDLKAGGNGYVCWPPTAGYDDHQDLPVAEFPMTVLSTALKAKGGTGSIHRKGNGSAMTETDAVYIGRIQDASEIYPALRQLSYRIPGRQHGGKPFTIEQGVEVLTAVMMTSVAADTSHPRHSDWQDRMSKIGDLVESAFSKRGLDVAAVNASLKKANPEGHSFFQARPVGPQRETKAADIERRIQDLPPGETHLDIHTISAQSLIAETLPAIEWIIPQMIPRQSTVSLAGTSNVGKTRWLAGLVAGLAVGDTTRMGLPQCMGRQSTLWIANEERVDDIKRRIKAVVRQHGDVESSDIYVRGKDSGMMRLVAFNELGTLEIDEEGVARVVWAARRGRVGLIIFDPYVTLSDGGADENSAASAAVLTKAFLRISELTGAAVLHAHHTPKGSSSLKRDWYRGDAGAWRGSGAIYSALDCGFTLSHWCPKAGTEIGKSWDANYLTAKLNRWIVLDTGKIREGEPLAPVVYEMVGQEMAPREGAAIGVCRLSSDREAEDSVLDNAITVLSTHTLADAIGGTLGVGRYPLSEAHRVLRGTPGWPDVPSLRDSHRDALQQQFRRPVRGENGSVQVTLNTHAATRGRWSIVVRSRVAEPDESST